MNDAPRPEPDVLDGVATIALGDVLLSLWRTPARVDRIRYVLARTEMMMQATPGSIVACQFLLSTASPPGRAERAEVRAGLGVVLPRARRLVTVPLGDAAWHSVVRTIVRAAVLLSGHSKIIRVASGAAEAFDLVAQVASPSSPPTPTLEAAFGSLYRALDLAPPSRAR